MHIDVLDYKPACVRQL